MKNLTKIIRKNQLFYLQFSSVIFLTIAYLLFFSKKEGFILMNGFHNNTLRNFFESMTFIGDGLCVVVVSFIVTLFFPKHRKLALLLIVSYLLSGVFSQLLKWVITAPRPCNYFRMYYPDFYLDTFKSSRLGNNSFPSGHSTSAFAMATVFSLYFKNNTVSIIALLVSLLVGYSRIYLGHHFLIDVFGGMVLGIVFGTLTVLWLKRVRVSKRLSLKHSYRKTLPRKVLNS